MYVSSCLYKGEAITRDSCRRIELLKKKNYSNKKILKRTPSLPSLSSIRRGVCVWDVEEATADWPENATAKKIYKCVGLYLITSFFFKFIFPRAFMSRAAFLSAMCQSRVSNGNNRLHTHTLFNICKFNVELF